MTDLATLHDGGQELRDLVQRAEVIHLIDLLPSELPLSRSYRGARWVFESSGRRPDIQADLATSANKLGASIICHQPPRRDEIDGLDPASVEFLPPFLPFDQLPWLPLTAGARARARGCASVVFCSSSTPLPSRARLETLVDRAETEANAGRPLPIRVEVVVGRPLRSTLQRQRRAHVVLADADGQMPVEALAALAQGVPVLADLDGHVLRAYEALVGDTVPIYQTNQLGPLLDQLNTGADPEAWLRRWVLRACNPERWHARLGRLYAPAPQRQTG